MRQQPEHRFQPNRTLQFLLMYVNYVRQQRENWISNLVLESKRATHHRCFRTSPTVAQGKHFTTWEQLFNVYGFRFPVVLQQVRTAVREDDEIAAHRGNLCPSLLKSDPALTALEEVKVGVVLGL